MDIQVAMNHLGQIGTYQKLLLAVCFLAVAPSAFNTMGIVFLAGTPKHWCESPDIQQLNLTVDEIQNITIPLVEKDGQLAYSSCSRYVYDKAYADWDPDDVRYAIGMDRSNLTTEDCLYGWHYDDDVYTSTIISQWDIVCDRIWLKAIASSIYMAGFMAGVIISGTISDTFGRKPTVVICFIGTVVSALCVSFSPNFITFCCLRCATAFFGIAMGTTKFVLMMEWMGVNFRPHAGMVVSYAWALWYLSFALFAYYIRNWITLNEVSSGFQIGCLLVIFFLPESPRWLHQRGRSSEAEKLIRKAAKINGVKIDTFDVAVSTKTKQGYIWDLCRTPRMTGRSVNIFYNWFVNSCVYYGLSLNTSNLGGSAYINFAISASVEIPAVALTQLLACYMGRRWPLCVSMVIGGVALLCTLAIPPELNWIAITLAMVGKFGISMSFGIIYIFTVELYPTVVRNIGLGTASFWARIGGILAPFIAQMGEFNKYLPLITFGILSVSAGLLALILPETKGKPLPETLQDGENLGRIIPVKDVVTEGEKNPAYMESEHF